MYIFLCFTITLHKVSADRQYSVALYVKVVAVGDTAVQGTSYIRVALADSTGCVRGTFSAEHETLLKADRTLGIRGIRLFMLGRELLCVGE